MIYGIPPIRIEDDSTDLIGIRTLVLSQLWQPSRWPLTDAEYDAEKPGIPAVEGGMILIGNQTRPINGALRTSWTFEGISGDGKSVTFKDRANTIDYGFDPGFAQVDIKLHPDYQKLKDTYGGSEDGSQVNWPPTISSGNSGATGLGGALDSSGDMTNPMFGVQDFLRLEGTYRCRYASLTLSDAESGIGRIFENNLPGIAPVFPGRNWLKAPSPYQRRGPVFDITEIYWLSGPGGWPDPVYGTSSQR